MRTAISPGQCLSATQPFLVSSRNPPPHIFLVSIPTGYTVAATYNSFETTVKADFLNPQFLKSPDNSATERNFPSPVDKLCNFDF